MIRSLSKLFRIQESKRFFGIGRNNRKAANVSNVTNDQNEEVIIPWVREELLVDQKGANSTVERSKEICPICTDDDATFQLKCGHIFHEDCIRMQIKSKWAGARVTFKFLDCAICRQEIAHDALVTEIQKFKEMQKKIEELAIAKAVEDDYTNGLKGDELLAYCMKTLAFYMCKKCSEPYCGGLISCAQDLEIDPKSLKCQKCIFEDKPLVVYLDEDEKIADLRCKIHGYKSAMFKCDSCCNIATYDCICNHFCERCHGQASMKKDYPCPGPKKCSLGIPHPKNLPAVHGSKPDPIPFVIGCMKCVGLQEENQFHGGAHVF